MIEKPKRPKKPDIQERQPPRTLQELMLRYDLDNTKIYDFLDGLVELLNTEKESIDISINDLNNKKVNKSGDTMTGGLFMQGNPIGFGSGGNIYFKEDGYGDKFRILPDFNGAGSSNKLIIQSTTGGAGEDPQNWENMAYLNADVGDLTIKGKLKSSNINTAKLFWGNSMSFTMQNGGHALVMLNNTDCLMIWMGGGVGSESITVVRLSGTEGQVNSSGTTVTVNFLDNRNFTGNAIIL